MVVRLRSKQNCAKRVGRTLVPGDITSRGYEDGGQDGPYPRSDLTGTCCECCHTLPSASCGAFPHHSTANQFMTPTLFANYARLGYENCDGMDEILAQIRREQRETRYADEEDDIADSVTHLQGSFRYSSTSDKSIEAVRLFHRRTQEMSSPGEDRSGNQRLAV